MFREYLNLGEELWDWSNMKYKQQRGDMIAPLTSFYEQFLTSA